MFKPGFSFFMRRNPLQDALLKSMKLLLELPCPGCGGSTAGNSGGLCPECLANVKHIKEPRCPGCGGTNDGIMTECDQCIKTGDKPWDDAYAVFDYSGVIRKLIVQLKFNRRPEIGIFLAGLASENAREYLLGYDVIVPVPLHFLRRLRRGYNQCEIIAHELYIQTGIECKNLLRRRKYTAPQSRKSRAKRLKSMHNAFTLTPDAKDFIRGRKVLLLDDVFTTGATLNAAARAIQTGNPARIGILTLARRGAV